MERTEAIRLAAIAEYANMHGTLGNVDVAPLCADAQRAVVEALGADGCDALAQIVTASRASAEDLLRTALDPDGPTSLLAQIDALIPH